MKKRHAKKQDKKQKRNAEVQATINSAIQAAQTSYLNCTSMMNKNVDTKYFTIDFFKKGTAHLKFKDMELLKKFNIYAGRRKQWLPPSYGSKHYEAMNEEEKAVIDSFEGKDSYEDTFYNRDFYLNSGNNMLMLNAGANN